MNQLHIDDTLTSLNAEQLKKIARLWGGDGKQRKPEAIETIRIGLGIPNRVKAMLEQLVPYEYNALALAKLFNNQHITSTILMVAIYSSGVVTRELAKRFNDHKTIMQDILNHGLFIYQSTTGYYSSNYQYGSSELVTDDRILAQVKQPIYIPLAIQPATITAPAMYRRPSNVTLDIITLLQAVETMGKIELTKAGRVKANAFRQFRNILGWKKDDLELDGLTFNQAPTALFATLQHSSLFKTTSEQLVLTESAAQFASRTPIEQVNILLNGFINQIDWLEKAANFSGDGEKNRAARLGLLVMLAALPLDQTGFFSFGEFENAWFDRVGENFSIGHLTTRPFYFREETAEIKKKELERIAKLRESWLKLERVWIEKALTTWLYYLGMVELQVLETHVVGLRLTDLGRAVLHPELAGDMPTAKSGFAEPAWIVQPNYDVVVYLEKASPEQLIFLERYAERKQIQQHIAQYQLNKNSVYMGLERGSEIDTFIEQLQAGSTVPLPQNIVMDLQEWGQLRNQMTLHYNASIVQYNNETERDLLTVHLKGKPVGDCFFLLEQPLNHWQEIRIDYKQPLPRCLAINEDGIIKVKRTNNDLLLNIQLSKWAEPRSDQMWQLTQESINQALAAKSRMNELFNLLDERLLVSRLPAFLEQTLHAWGGKKFNVAVANISVVYCPSPELFKAITKSRNLKPYIKRILSADLLLVDTNQLSELNEKLSWAGFNIVQELTLGDNTL